jgi:UDP-N-acetylbacillosamine N-acetyltransferase
VTDDKSKVILVGGFHEMVELCEAIGVEIAGIIDPATTGTFLGHAILGRDEDAPKLAARWGAVPVVFTPDAPAVRERLQAAYEQAGFRSRALVHPTALISRTARIGTGTVIQFGAQISSEARVGDYVKVNAGAMIMHDATVGAFSTVAPAAVVLGRVQIGRGCYVGANATILPELTVGDGAVVGAGAVVTRSVPERTIVKGNPAR